MSKITRSRITGMKELKEKLKSVSDGIIHDAMAEPYARLNFDKSVYKEGQEVAEKLAKPLNLEDWS